MNLLGVIPPKKINLFIVSFLLGLFLALSFEPFKVPFLSLFIIGVYFLLNDTVFKSFQNYHKIFFYNGILFGFGFFLLSMYWVSNSILELNDKLFYIAPIILIFLPFCLSIFFGIMQLINSFMWSTSNSKLLYVNKIFKSNNLTESQKVNVIAAFDKAETVKEVKLVYETVADNIAKPVNSIKESKGMASKATGISRTKKVAPKRAVINESDNMVSRFQKLANIKISE